MSKINEQLTAMDKNALKHGVFRESLNDLYTVQDWTADENTALEQFLDSNPTYVATCTYLNKKLTESFKSMDYSTQTMLSEDLSSAELAQIQKSLTSIFENDIDDYKVIANDDTHIEISFCTYAKPNKIKTQREINKVFVATEYDDDIKVMFASAGYNPENPDGNYVVVSAYKE